MTEIVTLDIETENTGYDIMNNNKSILSIQLLSNLKKIFYDGSEKNDIDEGKKELISHIEQGNTFLGFNIRNFDIPMIKKFLDIEIPSEQIIDISEMDSVTEMKKKIGRKRISLFQVCQQIGIDAGHKTDMDNLAKKFLDLPSVVELAKKGADEWVTTLGWGYDFSFGLAKKRIAGGMAIFESFKEFVNSGGSQESLFYRYAMSDVDVKHAVYEKLEHI